MQELLKIFDFHNYKNLFRIFGNSSLCHYGTLVLSRQKIVAYKESKNLRLKLQKIISRRVCQEEDIELYNNALKTQLKYKGKLGFADCIIMEVMKNMGINEIASFDRHFDGKEGIKRITIS